MREWPETCPFKTSEWRPLRFSPAALVLTLLSMRLEN